MLLVLLPLAGFAQQLTGTLSGTTYDQSGAVVPNAKVEIKNESSNDVRGSVSDAQGVFTFSAVQPGSYSLTVSASGFQSWQINNIQMSQGDNRAIPNIALKVGNTSSAVEVVSAADAIAPVDTGDVSTTLNNHMVTELSLQGRDAGELIKIMPGMAIASGIGAGSGFTDRTVGSNSGPVGAYSANGSQPNGSMAYMLDGANLLDPGNMGTQIANINQDMTAEVKVLMSGYDAAYAKGPVVFQAFSKSGGAKFHGEGYLYARNSIFNSEEAYLKSQNIAKPTDYEYYPGGNIGGPVVLPFTKFNRNHDKLFFWFGYEYMRQQPSGTLWQTFVPTSQMRSGDFSQAYLSTLPASVNANVTTVPCPTAQPRTTCGGLTFPNGQIPMSAMDPQSLALLKTYPSPNVNPASHNGYNYQYLDQSGQNRWEQTEKIDYSISDNTKLTVSYGHQAESDLHPVQFWWAPAFSLPIPGGEAASLKSDTVMANLTHVFNSTLTNETVFTYARFINPLTQGSATAQNPATYGFTVPGLFGIKRVQLPNIISWSGNGYFAGYDQQGVFGGGFQGGTAFGGLKQTPAIYDNVSKVYGSHTMKFGVYWDSSGNVQSSSNPIQGTYDFETYGNTTTGNLYADFLTGRAQSYSQGNSSPVDDLRFHQYSLYAQDSWKVSHRLTVNYGLRADHIGQWYGTDKTGVSVFDLAAFEKNPNATNAGLLNHGNTPSIPLSGFKSPAFYYLPRFGAAYDIFGNGKTVVRGGFAVFRYQISQNSVGGAYDIGTGSFTANSVTGLTNLSAISNTAIVPIPATAGSISGNGTYNGVGPLERGDGKTPYTENYNFSIDQSFWRSLFEVSYVGNRSRDLLIQSGNTDFYNPNNVALGAFFKPDPITGVTNPTYNIPNTNQYRPIQQYGDINIVGHGSYSNYNSLQATWQKQTGPFTAMLNYTFSKVMGIRDGISTNGASAGQVVDPYNIKNNYGVLAYDHSQIFNAGYVWRMPSPIHGNAILKGAVNGWELSGVTQFQTGAPLQPNAGNLNIQYGQTYLGNSTTGVPQYGAPGPATWLGSNATGLTLLPTLLCDPRSGLKSGQYFNPSCFGVPAFGTQGSGIWPYIHLPAYFNSDLALFKNFKVKESQNVQFRFSAFNFMNRANEQFGRNGNSDISLNFQTPGTDASGRHLLTSTNTSLTTTGKPLYRVGDRLIEFAVKYNF